MTDSAVIWMSMVFWRTDSSKASSVSNAWFHKKKARAVLTTPSQMIIAQPETGIGFNPSNRNAEAESSAVPIPMANAVLPSGLTRV